MFLWRKEIDEKRLHKELGSSDRSEKPERLSEDIRVKHAHDGTGQPVESSSSRSLNVYILIPWNQERNSLRFGCPKNL